MDCNCQRISYQDTGAFSRIVTNYVARDTRLKPFYVHDVSEEGLRAAIENRSAKKVDRELLVKELRHQYKGIDDYDNVIEKLLSPDCFTITTAHQPNILTGPLYFIYKIVHAITLARHCKQLFPDKDFVPVYYMGSEDADLDELGHIYVDQKKYDWKTSQKGAVGRMILDKDFMRIINELYNQLAVLPNGNEIMDLVKNCYAEGTKVQDATFRFVHELFRKDGLLVLIPDSAGYKSSVADLFKDDLFNQKASGIIQTTIEGIDKAGFKVQANPREINLFYLEDGMRERIVKSGDQFEVLNTDKKFTESELLSELDNHPERFSPNVILRGIFQETILPNIAFIGGGGELAYWLQYGELFRHYNVPLPVLILRNSFLITDQRSSQKIERLGLKLSDFFMSEERVYARFVTMQSERKIKLNGSLEKINELYSNLRLQAQSVDQTLSRHVDALRTKAVDRLIELEKKMLRAEKKRFITQQRQISEIRSKLFPSGKLQERHDNVLYYLSKYGTAFIDLIRENSPSLDQEFVVIEIR